MIEKEIELEKNYLSNVNKFINMIIKDINLFNDQAKIDIMKLKEYSRIVK